MNEYTAALENVYKLFWTPQLLKMYADSEKGIKWLNA